MKEETRTNLPAIAEFYFEQNQVRTLFDTRTNEGYVCLSDILKAIGSKTRTNDVLPQVKELFGEGYVIVVPLQTVGGMQDVIFISEHAAAYVISRGRTQASKHLNRWLFMEVLPAIRKTGSYVAPGASVESAAERKAMEYAQKIMALQDELLDVYRQHGKGKIGPSALNAPYRPPLSSKERNEICRLRDEGLGTSEIARRVGCHKSTVRGILKKAGYPAQSPFGGRVSHE